MRKVIFLLLSAFSAGIYAQVGINTESPTATLDINGNLRIRNVPESTSTNDVTLVADADGNVKQQLSDKKGIFRGYLNADFNAGSSNGDIYKILNWNEIDDPHDDFTPSTGVFVAPVTGLYRINITAAISDRNVAPSNYVIGLADNTDKWVMRFSLPDSYVEDSESAIGSTSGFTGVVMLTVGQSYHFGVTYYATILANPSGNSGTGIGTYFDIELIKSL